jgi:FKBP-type peptidyl-prolyl cis-trans isomerase
MIKLKWILLFALGSVAMQAGAEQAIVIDAQAIGDAPPSATKEEANVPPQSELPLNEQAIANRERILKSGKMSHRQQAAMHKAEVGDSNKAEGEAFLAANKVKPGVVTLASGLQYKIFKTGKGKKATDSNVLICRYQATLIDGTTVDKTEGKQSTAMNVAGLLPGLHEAVKLMPLGSKWQIVIPPQLAYGTLGNRGVGSNAVVIYDLEIVDIK